MAILTLTDMEDQNDEKAKEIMYNISGCRNVTQFQALEKDKRDRALREMWKAGISMSRANRMTGISFGVIRKAVKL